MIMIAVIDINDNEGVIYIVQVSYVHSIIDYSEEYLTWKIAQQIHISYYCHSFKAEQYLSIKETLS